MNISAYFSHPIRGEKGADATREDTNLNNEIAIMVSQMVKDAFPALDLYVPAVHDEIIIELYEAKELAVGAILDGDKKILAKRDILIGFEYHAVLSKGMAIEYEEARRLGKRIFVFRTVQQIPELVASILAWYEMKEQEKNAL